MDTTQKLKILVCEADNRVLSRLKSWIEAIGEAPITTNDGIEAFGIFKETKPDIILISQELKSMGGIELLEKIKKIASNQATVLMLNSDYGEVFKRAIDLQVDKYLNKPVEAKPFFVAIESLAQEKIWHNEFLSQKRVLQDYKDAIDLSFSVSVHDAQGNIKYVNDLFCTTIKISHKEAMQGLINPFQNPNEDMESVWKNLQDNLLYKGRQVFKLNDKSERIIDITAVASLNDKDEVNEYLVFSDDVTEIIHSARKIKNQELDNRLDKLNHAKELNKVKDTFLTIFTHELKTPLNSIINFSEYVVKHLSRENFAKKDRLLHQVKEINVSGHFMLEMITNLMEALKLKDAKIVLHIVKVDVQNIINSLVETVRNNSDDIDIVNKEIKLDILSDNKYLNQILSNILSNAVKYASSKVEIIVLSDADDFSIEIHDDGKGFSAIENIFNLFEQSDSNSMTREARGTGVGLFIVKQLCDRMSYKVELSSSSLLGGARVVLKGKRDIRK